MKRIYIFTFGCFLFCAISFCSAEQASVLAANSENSVVVSTNALDSSTAPEIATSLKLETKIFQITYVPLQSAAKEVREFMGSSQGQVIVNEESRQLEVSAPPELLLKIQDLLSSLDKPHDILVDVKVLQIDLNEEHLPGINWSAIVSDYKSFTVQEDKRTFSVGTVSGEDLAVLLEALSTVGETKVFPVKTVKINSGSDADVRLKAFDRNVSVTIDSFKPSEESQQKQDRYTARLLVSPIVTSQNAVDLRIPSGLGDVISVHVKSDCVAVIGGIFTQTKSQSTKKFPFLGDLPLVGAVFRDQSTVVHRLENIIFLTPHISTPSVDAASK